MIWPEFQTTCAVNSTIKLIYWIIGIYQLSAAPPCHHPADLKPAVTRWDGGDDGVW